MHTLEVEVPLGERSYKIFIGQGLLRNPDLIQSFMPARQLFIVSNETIAPLHLSDITEKIACDTLILPDGEQYKTLDTLNKIFDSLLEKGHDRKTLLCALGGGVIGDMTGFAAAVYRRGVDYIQVPTSLLAQVDAAVGGKTGVNHPLGKNMLGAIHQPRAVIIDLDTLDTLPEREYTAGLAEVIKYGLLADAEFFQFLERHINAIRKRDKKILQQLIAHCCRIKADIVAQDETELGRRALLNLGHTFGHAIEAATAYKAWLHGEAVAIGLMMAADMSQRHGWLSGEDVLRIEKLLRALGLPTVVSGRLTPENLLRYMRLDKKTLASQLRLVLLKKLGEAAIVNDFSMQDLQACLTHFACISKQ